MNERAVIGVGFSVDGIKNPETTMTSPASAPAIHALRG
jgi:hypothetical protein